jgi:hypothetical protein
MSYALAGSSFPVTSLWPPEQRLDDVRADALPTVYPDLRGHRLSLGPGPSKAQSDGAADACATSGAAACIL